MDRQGMTQQGPPRPFWLLRSGGDDVVGEGVLWVDGVLAVRWCGQWGVSVWSGGLETFLAVHGRPTVHWSPPALPHLPRAPQPTPHAPEPAPRSSGSFPGVAAVARPGEAPPVVVEAPPGRWLPAPTLDGRCVRCGQAWPCLECPP